MTPLAFAASAAVLFAAVVAGALALGTMEWLAWRLARRGGVPLSGARSWSDWLGGVAGLLHPDAGRKETPAVALGFAWIVFGALLTPALLAWETVRGASAASASVRLGLLALAPLLCALGYAIAAERADTQAHARERLHNAGRIVFSLPAWLVAAALAATGGAVNMPLLGRAGLALALLWSGLFVLPGAVCENDLSSRTWGGDPREPSAVVRFLTGTAQYAALAGVCGFAALTLGGAGAGVFAGALPLFAAVLVALVLRALAALPRWGEWVVRGRVWLVPALLVVYAAAWPRFAGSAP